jgi:plasmid stability protein
MRALSIRNIPPDVYETLQALAAANHRSLQEQVRLLLEREAHMARQGGLAAARAWREKLAGRRFGDTVADVRADRAR